MAESVYLQDGRTSGETATILFEGELKEFGVEARVASFGAPGYTPGAPMQRSDNRYGLNLEVILGNGKLKSFEFDVTEPGSRTASRRRDYGRRARGHGRRSPEAMPVSRWK